MRMLTFIIAFLAMGFLAMAGDSLKPQSDADIRQKIVGTWIIDLETMNHTGPYSYSAKGTVTYSSNGCYVAKAAVLDSGKAREEKYEGFWSVNDGILTDTITNANGMLGITNGIGFSGPNPKFEVAKVLHVDENELILESGKRTKHKEIEKRSK
jgi:hypothetical protein